MSYTIENRPTLRESYSDNKNYANLDVNEHFAFLESLRRQADFLFPMGADMRAYYDPKFGTHGWLGSPLHEIMCEYGLVCEADYIRSGEDSEWPCYISLDEERFHVTNEEETDNWIPEGIACGDCTRYHFSEKRVA